MQTRCEQYLGFGTRIFGGQAAAVGPVEQILFRSLSWSSKFLFLICWSVRGIATRLILAVELFREARGSYKVAADITAHLYIAASRLCLYPVVQHVRCARSLSPCLRCAFVCLVSNFCSQHVNYISPVMSLFFHRNIAEVTAPYEEAQACEGCVSQRKYSLICPLM